MSRNDLIRFGFVLVILVAVLVYPVIGVDVNSQLLGAFGTILGYYFGVKTELDNSNGTEH